MELRAKTEAPRIAYSVANLATALEVSDHFLRRQIATGKLRAAKLGRRVVVLATDVEDFLKKNLIMIDD